MKGRSSLLEIVRGLLERTYRLRTGGLDLARFVIGDEGYREIYGTRREVRRVATATGEGARTLVRESADGVLARLYYPDALIDRLERHPPQRGLGEENVDGFAVLVEELDHLLCIADGAVQGRSLTLFELELHANVSKYLVLARFLAGEAGRLRTPERSWLRFHLFEKIRYRDGDPVVRERYREAARWAVRMLDAMASLPAPARVETLRTFHDLGAAGKLRLIDGLAAA